MVTHLCLDCHEKVHSYKVNIRTGETYNRELKQRYQRIFEAEHGSAEFRRIFGRSWL
jgi:hypothetical protein